MHRQTGPVFLHQQARTQFGILACSLCISQAPQARRPTNRRVRVLAAGEPLRRDASALLFDGDACGWSGGPVTPGVKGAPGAMVRQGHRCAAPARAQPIGLGSGLRGVLPKNQILTKNQTALLTSKQAKTSSVRCATFNRVLSLNSLLTANALPGISKTPLLSNR